MLHMRNVVPTILIHVQVIYDVKRIFGRKCEDAHITEFVPRDRDQATATSTWRSLPFPLTPRNLSKVDKAPPQLPPPPRPENLRCAAEPTLSRWTSAPTQTRRRSRPRRP